MIQGLEIILGLGIFAIGAVVGSFLNVCIYRIPWEKSIIWPASHCPKCLRPIATRDNIPIVSWLALRGECRNCALPISVRYPLIECLVAALFVGAFYVDVVHTPFGLLNAEAFARMIYHQVLLAALVTATFIDYDLQIIPDQITVPGMLCGLLAGTIFPGIRPEPGMADTALGGFWYGFLGLVVGGGLPFSIGLVFRLVRGKEGMGFGDVTLMAMIGSFLGWQAATMTFFLGAFYGLTHAFWQLLRIIVKKIRRLPKSPGDDALPFGPYLSMGAATLLFAWPWLWPSWGREFFNILAAVVRFYGTGGL